MWFLLLLIYVALSESVILEGENRMILRGGSHPCEGHVAIYHENVWGYVGDKGWSRATEEVACRSARCGSPEGPARDVGRPLDGKVWLNELKCNGSEAHLWDCGCPGWDISVYRKDTVKQIQCSNKVEMRLDEFNGKQICAGAVRWSANRTTGYFCADQWEQRDADHLCTSLNCGKSKELSMNEWGFWEGFKDSKKMTINCSNIESMNSLWQCITEEPAKCTSPVSVVCEGYERLQLTGDASNVCAGQLETYTNDEWTPFKNQTKADLWCRQMSCGTVVNNNLEVDGTLTCSDNVTVLLMNDSGHPSKCHGAVHVNVNGAIQPVCGSRWTRAEAEVVCKEQKCGNVVSHSLGSAGTAVMDNVNCLGSESSLWHCRARRRSSQCSSMAYVVCEGSVRVDLKDGPGKCAGRLEILYDGKWRQVDKTKWNDMASYTICNEMNCGSEGDVSFGKFIKGSNDFLTKTLNCHPNATTISECITDTPNPNANANANANPNPNKDKEPVEITCEEHKMVFLEGSHSCSGMVGIAYQDNTYWLSGSNETWNERSANTVCQQMHCGDAYNFTTFNQTDMGMDIWEESYNCSPNDISLFDCALGESPSNNDSIAVVNCTGSITLNLTNTCWGHVLIDVEGRHGGVCGNSWTLQHSKMLCESNGCGNLVQIQKSQPGANSVIVKSFHAAKQDTSLAQHNLVLNEGNNNVCKEEQAYVVCSGSVKSRLSLSKDKCSGNVDLLFENQWLPVCTTALNNTVTGTICNELDCGQAGEVIKHFGPKPNQDRNMISEIQCPTNGMKSLRDCKITLGSKCTPAGLRCTKWEKMRISNTCTGAVFVYSNGKREAVSGDSLGKGEANTLCQDLNCGSLVSMNYSQVSSNFLKSTFSCQAGQRSNKIWDCENGTIASPIAKGQLNIKCQDEPKITLSQPCHGVVKINETEVCDRHWDKTYSHLVCQELNCSNAIVGESKGEHAKANIQYHHVSCDDNNYKLGQCQRVKGKCDGQLVSVYCVANVKFKTLKKCGGQIQVDYGTGWKKVCPVTLSEEFKIKLCQELNKDQTTKCGGPVNLPQERKTVEKVMNVSLKCSTNHMDLRHCVVRESCENVRPAEIFCEGYKHDKEVIVTPPVNIVHVLLGIGLFLVLVIVAIVLVRFYIIKKRKNTRARMLSRNEVEFESGDYEDVKNKENEMEDFSHGRLKSQAEVSADNDARSASSLHYDDIDEVLEAQPLTTASRDNMQGESLDQTDGGVTYEVDDPQESYDDIASPEITNQTKAEVYDSPTATSENKTVPLPLLGQEGGDYLDPDQDG